MRIKKNDSLVSGKVQLPISKSLFNRQLIIQALTNSELYLSDDNLPDDCKVLIQSLSSNSDSIDVGHAGTAMRFLTAYFTLQERDVTLSGSDRMHQRPIAILVKALNELGADVSHVKGNDCPPLKIGNHIPQGGVVTISGSVSSQYISALLLIAPKLKKGLALTITSPWVSRPYISMTLNLMASHGIKFDIQENVISIAPQDYRVSNFVMEMDWSAASFWYEFITLNQGSEIILSGLRKESLQGDAILPELYRSLGVETTFLDEGVLLKQVGHVEEAYHANCTNFPDLALPLACTCAGLGIDCHLDGLETLFIKETNRVLALNIELTKFGLDVKITKSSLSFAGHKLEAPTSSIKTYKDHRMAMSFAPLVSVVGELFIDDSEVVSKSYPNYWEMLEKFVEVP